MAETIQGLLAGYVLDGSKFQRGRVNGKNRVINAETKEIIDGAPSMMIWYTRREFVNALARVEKQTGQQQHLVNVELTPELLTALKESGAQHRLTVDHIHHLLMAGKERVLGRSFTPEEIRGYQREAETMLAQLEEAVAAKAA